ncbi:MAG: hypothetical protein KDK78_04180, partial [Chlamydiia bacterium]|nr:hypothetical protein [Chlamydiia bacterium]
MGEVAASCIIEGIEEKIDLEQRKIDRPDSPYTVRRGLLQAAWKLELNTDRSLIKLWACDGQSHFSTFFRWTQWTPSYCFHSVEFPSSVEGLGRRTFRAWRKEIYSQVASTIKKSVKTWAAGRGLRMYARDELTHGHR